MKIPFFIVLFICGINTSFAEDVWSNRDWYRNISSDSSECLIQVNNRFPDYNTEPLNPDLKSKAGAIDTGIRAIFGLIGTAIGQTSIQLKKRSAYNSCMNSKGWETISKEDGDKLNSRQMAIFEQINALQSNALQSELFCKNPELAEFYKRTSCTVSDLTPNNLSDKAFVSPNEVEFITKFKFLYTQQTEKIIELYKQMDTTYTDEVANVYSSISIRVLENASNLMDKKITWGAFNVQRKKNGDSFTNAWNEAQRKLKLSKESIKDSTQ